MVSAFVIVSTEWSVSCLLFFYSQCPSPPPLCYSRVIRSRRHWAALNLHCCLLVRFIIVISFCSLFCCYNFRYSLLAVTNGFISYRPSFLVFLVVLLVHLCIYITPLFGRLCIGRHCKFVIFLLCSANVKRFTTQNHWQSKMLHFGWDTQMIETKKTMKN